MSKKLPHGKTFKAIRYLGKGAFSKVYYGERKRKKQPCAIKVIDLTKENNERERVLIEIDIMSKMKHENCVELYEIEPKNYKTADRISLVMEFCDKGELGKFLQEKAEKAKMDEIKDLFIQIVKGLRYVYDHRIVHRDLKPQNILLKTDPNNKDRCIAKLADFGLAREIPKDDLGRSGLMETICGSPLYMAPEVLFQQPYTLKADLWSLGAILYEMITGSFAFEATSLAHLLLIYQTVTTKKLPANFNNTVPEDCRNLVERLLTADPESRISREELYQHPFIRDAFQVNSPKEKELQKRIIGIANADYPTIDPKELVLRKGDILEITKIKEEGWCIATLGKRDGIVPINFIDLYEEVPDIFTNISSEEKGKGKGKRKKEKKQKQMIGIAKFDFPTKEMRELPLSEGNCVTVLTIKPDGWCNVTLSDKGGLVPLFFLDIFAKMKMSEDENNKQKNKINSNDGKLKQKYDSLTNSFEIVQDPNFNPDPQPDPTFTPKKNKHHKNKHHKDKRKEKHIEKNIEKKEQEQQKEQKSQRVLGLAKRDFYSNKKDELSFQQDDQVIIIIVNGNNDWGEGTMNGKQGKVPIDYFYLVPDDGDMQLPPSNQNATQNEEKNPKQESNPNFIKDPKHEKNQNFIPDPNLSDEEFFVGFAQKDFNATYNDELSFKQGEVVFITKIKDSNWGYGKMGQNKGKVPLDYFELHQSNYKEFEQNYNLNQNEEKNQKQDRNKNELKNPNSANKYRAQKGYKAQKQDELSFEVGDIVEVTYQTDDGWWEGTINGKKGFFPIESFRKF